MQHLAGRGDWAHKTVPVLQELSLGVAAAAPCNAGPVTTMNVSKEKSNADDSGPGPENG